MKATNFVSELNVDDEGEKTKLLIQRGKPFELECSISKLLLHEPNNTEGKTFDVSELNEHFDDSFAASIPLLNDNELFPFFNSIPRKKRTPRYEVFQCGYTCSMYNQEEDEKVSKKQKGKKRSKVGLKAKRPKPNPNPTIITDIPVDVAKRIDEIGGVDLVLVIQKNLFNTDLEPNNNRLSIPGLQVKSEFLTEEEKRRLNPQNPMQVCLLDPSLRKFDLKLTNWMMNKRVCYNLIENWNTVVKMNKNVLRVNVLVQLWAYRVESKLNFALVVVK